MTTARPGFQEPLAAALWEARATCSAIDREPWADLSMERASAVADELYRRLEADGARRVGAKVAATDVPTQRLLGADGPLVAPVFSDAVIAVGTVISLSAFITPRLEAEIGMQVTEEGSVAVPCVEIPDSRFAGGAPTIAQVAADFGGQAAMLFGAPGSVEELVEVTVTRDGEQVASASRGLGVARTMLDLVHERFPELGSSQSAYVATGTLIPPLPLEPGRWLVDFGALGAIDFQVVA